jgi:hypothetical protein
MPGYFLGSPIAGWTQHFLVTYAAENDQDAFARAQAILGTCEADLATLETWFNCNFDQASYAVWVHVAPGVPGGGASNYGYDDSTSSRIIINGTFKPAQPTRYDIFDDFPRMLFVAEMIEVLMDFTGYKWGRGDSAGEALSHIAAAELHAGAYYTFGAAAGPYVNRWLQTNPRPDWVSSNEGSDQNSTSYGCGILFINYLVYQLGFSFPAIVSAGGGSLSETFARLTGQPAANAFSGFEALLEKHLPSGQPSNIRRDNIFPLRDPEHRSVTLTVNESTLSSTQQPQSFVLTIPPPEKKAPVVPPCMAGTYIYQIEDVTTELDVVARAFGYAQPAFSWSINGTPLPIHDGKLHDVNVDVTITDVTPSPVDAPLPFLLPVQYFIVDGFGTSTLKFANQAFPGNCDIDIACGAKEVLVAGDPITTFNETWGFQMRSYDMSAAYYAALYRCSSHPVIEMSTAVAEILDQIFILLNTPDPAPDQVVALAAQTARYLKGLKQITGGSIGLRGAARAVAKLGQSSLPATKTTDLAGIPGGLPVRARYVPEGTGASREPKVDPLTGATVPGSAPQPPPK